MKPACGVFLLVFLLSLRIACAQEENSSVLDKKIKLEIQNQSITSILDSISSQAHVFFSYDAILIEADKKTNLSVAGVRLAETLDTLLHARFEYQVLGDQIIIAKHVESKPQIESRDEKAKTIRFLGRVIDREEKEVLPFTSISILRSHIGTVSNMDGDFELKIPEPMNRDTIVFSHIGYRQYRKPISEIAGDSCTIYLQPISVQLKEIKVMVIDPENIVDKIISKISLNYPQDPELMTAFYREVLKQDTKYIDIAEAVVEIRKTPYDNSAEDKVKVVKGRRSRNVQAFQYVDFKIQGGPYYITKLDVIKTIDNFLDPQFRDIYKYSLDEIVELDERSTYVIRFKPREKIDDPSYQGKLFVDMSTLALVQAQFSLSRSGLKYAEQSLIKKKPKDYFVRPLVADYQVSYRRANNKWHLSMAQTSVKFKVKSKKEKVNSTFHTVSDLLITDFTPNAGPHFKRDEVFSPKDIFTETITSYDKDFWGSYNIIKPTEELQEALHNYYLKNDSLFRVNEKENQVKNKK